METKTNTETEKAFFDAVRNGRTDDVRRMVKDDPSLLRAYDHREFGAPCLNLAGGFRRNFEMVELLLELGADPNQKSDWWAGPWSPALISLNYGDNKMSEFLVSRGAEIDIHLASGLAKLDALAAILDKGPSQLHARGGDGCMPLHFAGSPDVVDFLLARGADIEARDVDHYSTPVQWLCTRCPPSARHLYERGATPDIISASACGSIATVKKLVERNPAVLQQKINATIFPPGPHDVSNIMFFSIGENATPLHAAASGRQIEMIKFLVSSGLDVNSTGGYDECTALHIAAWNDYDEVARTLIEAGADIEKESGKIHRNTPLGWAIVAGSINVARRLINQGCAMRTYYKIDAEKGLAGEFKQFKVIPSENYREILRLLK
jgi:ankyrin repeat protein